MKNTFLSLLLLIVFCSLTYAHSPKEIELEYSYDTQTLNVSASHVVDDKDKHFIRKIEILKSDEIIKTVYYPKQKDIRIFKESIPLNLAEGESIIVKIYSKTGGASEKKFIAPKIITKEGE